MIRVAGWLIFAALLLTAGGCGPARIYLNVQRDVNPDIHGRPSPVVLRMYELKSLSAFNGADFFSLYEKDQGTLGSDMLAREEFFLRPGEKREFKRKLQDDTRFVAVVAAFRDWEHSQWRSSMPVTPGRRATVVVTLEGKKVTVAAK
ncbi:MAG: type VI secretion system lipoprotein TssJ [Pseudolabrys sp.]